MRVARDTVAVQVAGRAGSQLVHVPTADVRAVEAALDHKPDGDLIEPDSPAFHAHRWLARARTDGECVLDEYLRAEVLQAIQRLPDERVTPPLAELCRHLLAAVQAAQPTRKRRERAGKGRGRL